MSQFAGWLGQRYRVNRPLSEYERLADVRLLDSTAMDPIDQGIIKIDECSIEYVDRHFVYRGWGGDVGVAGGGAGSRVRCWDPLEALANSTEGASGRVIGRLLHGGIYSFAVHWIGGVRILDVDWKGYFQVSILSRQVQ